MNTRLGYMAWGLAWVLYRPDYWQLACCTGSGRQRRLCRVPGLSEWRE